MKPVLSSVEPSPRSRRPIPRQLLALFAVVGLACNVALTGAADPGAVAWQFVTIPNLPTGAPLGGVWTGGPNDVYVWAWRTTPVTADVPEAFLFHFDGADWNQSLHLPGHHPARVFGTSAADVWITANKCAAGFAAGCGADRGARIFHSTDGGATWISQTLPPEVGNNNANIITGTPNNIHVRVETDYGHKIIRFDGTSWTLIQNCDAWCEPYGIYVFAPDEGYTVSCWGWARWNGASWQFNNQGWDFCDAYGGVWAMRDGSGALQMYAVGQNNFGNGVRVWKFNETTQSFGGKYGYVFADGNGSNIGGAYGVWGSAADDVYVTGALAETSGGPRTGRLYHYDGAAWSRITSFGTIAQPGGISGSARENVWMSLTDGRLLRLASAVVPPTIHCPGNLVATAGPCQNGAPVNYTVTAEGGTPPVTVTCVPPSGSTFPLGTTTVTCTATDATGQTASCSFTVTVQAPASGGAFVYFSEFADGLSRIKRVRPDGSGLETLLVGSGFYDRFTGIALDVAAGHLYSGNNQWLFRANLDGTGRVNLVPAINQFQDVELDLVHGKIYWSEGAGGRNAIRCANLDGSNPRTFIDVGYAGYFAGLAVDPTGGRLYFVYDVNVGADTIQVMNLDGSGQRVLYNLGDPNFDPGDLELDLATGTLYFNHGSDGGLFKAPVDGSGPVAQIVVTPDGATGGFHFDPVDHKLYFIPYKVPGGYRIRSTNLDGTGGFTVVQSSGLLYRVEVGHEGGNDDLPPTITCPGNMVVSCDPGKCSAVVTFAVTATDDCGEVPEVCTPPCGSVFPKGTTTVNCTATDATGQTATCSFTVTVNDTEAPVVTCPANIVTSTDAGQCSAVVTYAVTAADNCGGAIVTCTPPSGATFPKGTTTVTATATDSAGNVATGSFTVTVNDTEAPAITCPANIALSCGVDRLLPAAFAATATDNCDPAPTVSYSIPPGSGFPIGATAATVTATDASGNASQCAFTITRAALGFTGFLPPIGGADATGGSFTAPVRSFKLKSTIPVKFTASCDGSLVLAGVHTLQVIKWSNETDSDPPIDATPTDAATTGNQFRLAGSEWHYNLATLATGMSVGKWQLIATLSDGSQHSVWIQIK